MKPILAALAALCVSYLAIAFVVWEFDPGKWNGADRFICAWLGVFASIAAAGFTSMVEK